MTLRISICRGSGCFRSWTMRIDSHIQQRYHPRMVRTQIYIPARTHQRLVRLARAKRESMANVVRTLIEGGLQAVAERDTSGITVLQELAKMKLKGGPKDLSSNIDHYLYGAPKKTISE